MLMIPHNVPGPAHSEALDIWQHFEVFLAGVPIRVIVKMFDHWGFLAMTALDSQHSGLWEKASNVIKYLLQGSIPTRESKMVVGTGAVRNNEVVHVGH